MTSQQRAVKRDNLKKVIYLIRSSPDVNREDVGGRTLLRRFNSDNVEVMKALISAGANMYATNGYGMTPLHCEADAGNLNIVKELISAGIDVNVQDRNGCTPLHHSAQKGHLDIVEELVSAGADVNVKDKKRWTPLHRCVVKGDSNIVKALIAAGADVNEKDENDWTPLHRCVLMGQLNNVNALVSAGADVNVKDEMGWTPLHRCVVRNQSHIVKALISAGAEINAKDKKGKTPLDRAGTYKHEKICIYLIRYSLLYSHTPSKPTFQISDSNKKSEIWNICEDQVKKLKETFLGESCVSCFRYLTETDVNKVALYTSEEYFGISNKLNRALYLKKFPMYAEDMKCQFAKGSKRANLLFQSQALMKSDICKMLPIEIIRKICEFLRNEDLVNFISSHKFNNA